MQQLTIIRVLCQTVASAATMRWTQCYALRILEINKCSSHRPLECDATTVNPPNGHRAGGAVRNRPLGDARFRSVPSDRRSR